MSIASEPQKRVFISHAHASDEHKLWVKKLAESLHSQSITVTLDQDDLRLGQLIWKFEKDGISLADRVSVICSDTYVDKCDTVPESGAGQEKALISVELENNQGSIKFIPVLRDNSLGKKPSCLAQRMWPDANRDEDFPEVVQRLSAEIKRH